MGRSGLCSICYTMNSQRDRSYEMQHRMEKMEGAMGFLLDLNSQGPKLAQTCVPIWTPIWLLPASIWLPKLGLRT